MTADIAHTNGDTFATTHHFARLTVRDTLSLFWPVAWLALLYTVSAGTTFKSLPARLHTSPVHHCPGRLAVRDTGSGFQDLSCWTGWPTDEGACCIDTLAGCVTSIGVPTLIHISTGPPVVTQLQAAGTRAEGLALQADAGVGAAAVVLPAEVLWLTAVPVSGKPSAGEAAAVAAVESLHVGAGILTGTVAVVGQALVAVHTAVAVVTQVVAAWTGA